MKKTQQFLSKLDLPSEDNHALKSSWRRFPDGGYWRFEIPSVEGPRAFREVLAAAKELQVPVHRVSEGSGIMLLTPDGRVAQYYYGIEYAPRDIQLGLIEASKGKIGNVVDQVLLYCYHYDPRQGRYGAAIFNVLRLSALATVLVLGGFMLLMFRRDALAAREGRLTRTAN